MNVELREDSVVITGYVNAVERLSKPIRETLHSKVRTFLERIKAGVFRTALKRNDDVLVLLNHDYNRVLAKTSDGTAILEEDNIGLRAEITITDNEVVQKARDGKLSGWSFGFIANDDELSNEGENEIRTVLDLDLLEVSILDDTKTPAYYGTSIEARKGGARMVEVRSEPLVNEPEPPVVEAQEGEQTIDIEQLAQLVANKVIEALKSEEKAEEPPAEEPPTEEPPAEEQQEENTEDEEAEEENRSIDYTSFEQRLSKIMK